MCLQYTLTPFPPYILESLGLPPQPHFLYAALAWHTNRCLVTMFWHLGLYQARMQTVNTEIIVCIQSFTGWCDITTTMSFIVSRAQESTYGRARFADYPGPYAGGFGGTPTAAEDPLFSPSKTASRSASDSLHCMVNLTTINEDSKVLVSVSLCFVQATGP